eukprot:UN06515
MDFGLVGHIQNQNYRKCMIMNYHKLQKNMMHQINGNGKSKCDYHNVLKGKKSLIHHIILIMMIIQCHPLLILHIEHLLKRSKQKKALHT